MDINEGKKENSRNEGANSFFVQRRLRYGSFFVLFFIGIISLGIGVLYYAVMLLLMILSAFEILVSFADPYGGTPVIDLVNKMIIMMGYPFMVLIFSVYVLEVRAIIINVKCGKEVKV